MHLYPCPVGYTCSNTPCQTRAGFCQKLAHVLQDMLLHGIAHIPKHAVRQAASNINVHIVYQMFWQALCLIHQGRNSSVMATASQADSPSEPGAAAAVGLVIQAGCTAPLPRPRGARAAAPPWLAGLSSAMSSTSSPIMSYCWPSLVKAAFKAASPAAKWPQSTWPPVARRMGQHAD